MKNNHLKWGVSIIIFVLMAMPARYAGAKSTKQPKKTELVQYATGPAGEANPERLGVRSVELETPDSDGAEALKTTGAFIVDFISMPFKIVKVLWESVTE